MTMKPVPSRKDRLVMPKSKEEGVNKKLPLEKFHKFYSIKNDSNGNFEKIIIKRLEVVRILLKLGFRRYDKDGEYFIIRICENIAEQCNQTDVIDAFEEYLLQWESEKKIPHSSLPNGYGTDYLINILYANLDKLFSDSTLKRLRSKKEITFLKDTQTESFFCFSNGIVSVKKDEIALLPYASLKGQYIWKNQILPRDFKLLNRSDFYDFPFAKFVSNIAGNSFDQQENKFKDPIRFNSFKTVIGYNLHRYFEGKLKATIFTDSTLSDTADGRTGKTLLSKAIGTMLNKNTYAKTYVELNGKNFEFTDRFRYQECGLDTKLVHINDANKNFNFEQLFNDISEGIKAQKKGQTPFALKAKIIISTNRTIKVKGGSAKDRAVEIEMADYYDANFSPETEFGQWFFRDWDDAAWNCFDNFMLHCIQLYLKNGIITPSMINLNERKLIEETKRELVIFMDEYNIQVGERHDKKTIYEKFKYQFPDFHKLKQNTFTPWVRTYLEFRFQGKNITELRSNGRSYFEIQEKPKGLKN